MRTYSRLGLVFVLICVSFFTCFGIGGKLIPANLQCELRKEPVGVDVMNPDLSYLLTAVNKFDRNLKQIAYQIIVSSSKELLLKDYGDLWNSGKVLSDRTAYINYKGTPLRSNQKCWWRVRVWDNNGNLSAWSSVNSWTMGIIKEENWSAKWISADGADKYALSPVGFKSADAGSENESKWVQVDLGTSQTFSVIKLFPSFYHDRAGYAFPARFKVVASDDRAFNSSFIVADYTSTGFVNPRFKPATFNPGKVSARYIRVVVTRLPRIGDNKYAYSFRQIEVWSAGKNIAAGKLVESSDSDDTDGFNKNNLTDRVSDHNSFPNYSSMMLRKDFSVKPSLARAVIHISGLSQYELTVNGKKIGNYLITPGWTDYRKTVLYDSYDITRQLANGGNAIGIILGNGVHNIQPDTTRYVKFITTFGQLQAIAQLYLEYTDGTVKTIVTDNSWQVSPGPFTYTNLYGGEDYDAALEPKGWNKAEFKSGNKWKTAIEITGPGGTLKGLSSAAPPIVAIDSLDPVSITRIKDNIWIYDFGQNASMMPLLTVSGPKGSYVRMIPSELLGDNGLVDRKSATQDLVRPAWWQYTLSGGQKEKWFPKFFYQGARYLQVELYPASNNSILPKILQLTDVIVHSSSEMIGSFETSNTLFNKIHSLVRWAQRSNMMSLMTDCPHREKMGWLEENQLNGPSLRYNFDMALLCRKLMNDIADAQLDNGFVPNIAPEYFIAGSPDLTNAMRNSPEWGSSFIIVPWQQYLFSGDISLLQRYYDRMKRYVDFLASTAKDNIIYTGLGDWYDIGPKEAWGSQLTPPPFTATTIFYYDNWIMHHISKQLGKEQDAIAFKKAYEAIKESFNKKFFKAETGLYSTGSQTTCAMPIYFNLVSPENRQKLLTTLVDSIRKRDNSFTSGEVGYRFLLRALADNGYSDVVYDMNNQTEKPGYGYQIKKGATSLTEKWDAGVGNFGSQNHFMSGQINEWLFSSLTGINPDESGMGFQKIIFKPSLVGDLKWVKGSFVSIGGLIKSEWKKENNKLIMNLTIPPNTTATIYIPSGAGKGIEESGKSISTNSGIKLIHFENGYQVLETGSGSYSFSTEL